MIIWQLFDTRWCTKQVILRVTLLDLQVAGLQGCASTLGPKSFLALPGLEHGSPAFMASALPTEGQITTKMDGPGYLVVSFFMTQPRFKLLDSLLNR